MKNSPSFVRRLVRRLLPLRIRSSRFAAWVKAHLLPHDITYNSEYYARTVEPTAMASAEVICDSILRDLEPTSVVDVGCGTGVLLETLHTRGCKVFGMEYSKAALALCRERQLDVMRFNLERDVLTDNRSFDVCVSTEVAEHLPEKVANRYIDLLTHLAAVIVFTAAPPGQGGADHVNEQPKSYWIAKFRDRGFHIDEALSQRWRSEWKAVGVAGWYHENLMIFRNACKV